MPDRRAPSKSAREVASRFERRISHAGNIPSVTTHDRHSRHRAVRDAETAQVAVTADQDAARAEKVTAVLIKRCRTVLTERCCYITKYRIANNSGRRVTQVSSHVTLRILYRSSSRAPAPSPDLRRTSLTTHRVLRGVLRTATWADSAGRRPSAELSHLVVCERRGPGLLPVVVFGVRVAQQAYAAGEVGQHERVAAVQVPRW